MNDTASCSPLPVTTFLSQLACSGYSTPDLHSTPKQDGGQSLQSFTRVNLSVSVDQPRLTTDSHLALTADLQGFLADRGLAGNDE